MRIEGVPQSKAGLLARMIYRFSRRRLGKVVDPLAVTAHSGWTLAGYGLFEVMAERARAVEPRLKELAQIKAATMIGCPF